MAGKRRDVLHLIHSGQVGRGMQPVTSNGVADAPYPAVNEQLRKKFPVRPDLLPETVPLASPIESFTSLRESLLSLEPKKSPGSGGMRPEYLHVLGERMTDSEMELLEEFGPELSLPGFINCGSPWQLFQYTRLMNRLI